MKKSVGMKGRNMVVIAFLFLFAMTGLGQTGINTAEVSPHAALQIDAKEDYKGLLVPQLTTNQRNAIRVTEEEDGLVIYNTDEQCFNFWSKQAKKWESVCGAEGKASFTIENCGTVKAAGYYHADQRLNDSHFVEVTVNVTKAGELSLSAMSEVHNGYYYHYSTNYVDEGITVVQLKAKGAPINAGVDRFILTKSADLNIANCEFTVEVQDAAAKPNFTMDCVATEVFGVYKLDHALTEANYMKVKLVAEASAVGVSYVLQTNEVDGIYFKGEGKLVEGEQIVTLRGYGIPYTTEDKRMRIQSNSATTSSVCYTKVRTVADKKRMIVFSRERGVVNQSIADPASSVYQMLNNPQNYGTLASSKVPFEGWEIITEQSGGGIDTGKLGLAAPNAYDIVVIENGSAAFTPEAFDALLRYLQKGGVVIVFNEKPLVGRDFFRKLTESNAVQVDNIHQAGVVYQFNNENDQLLNGSFGDIRGKYWGEDASKTARVIHAVGSDFIVYTDATDATVAVGSLPEENEPSENTLPGEVSSPDVEGQGTEGFTIVRHHTYAFVWVGDGGFNHAENPNSSTNSPFKTVDSVPVVKENYGYGTEQRPVSNAIFTANLFEWAIEFAESKGINRKVN